ncbi:MAG: hypothetical protein V4488_26635 [Pseudomonadota bacterium]
MLIAVIGVLLLASAAQAKNLALDNMPFLKARELILADGWLPLRTSDKDTVFTEGKWKAAVPEWDSCPTATGGCFFNYIKGKECLRVFASDTRLTKMIVRENFQEEISHVCPTGSSVPVTHPVPIVAPRKAKGDPWGAGRRHAIHPRQEADTGAWLETSEQGD